MKKKSASLLSLTLLSLFSNFPCVANAASECQIGYTVFRDTMYGSAIGAGVGTLYLVAASSTTRIPSTIATSALIGASVGVVVAGVEVYTQNCFHAQMASQHKSWLLTPDVFNLVTLENKDKNGNGPFYGLTFEKKI